MRKQSETVPLCASLEDIFTTLNGGNFSAKLDLWDAYHQVEVEHGSRKFLTIKTHRGLYQFTRLLFGVKQLRLFF